MGWLYKRDFFNQEGLLYLGKCVLGVTVIYLAAVYTRGMGRAVNPTYRNFINILANSSRDFSKENKALLSQFDFDFSAWPVEFRSSSSPSFKPAPVTVPPEHKTLFGGIKRVPIRFLSWLMVNSFGIKLVYPGSIQLLQTSIAPALQDGRAGLIKDKKAERFKLIAADGNTIDTIFLDRRSATTGKTLVISCDGNAGFYEIGVLGTPVEAGYSVLGWNHPGFGGSTGCPFPVNEVSAVDTVMQFAIGRLGFNPEDILLHGWSIGGFTSSWLAMTYPDVKGVILDATFDELLPLAIPRMPELLSPLVEEGVSQYINLNVAHHLKQFQGPVRLIRRRYDEMITIDQYAFGFIFILDLKS